MTPFETRRMGRTNLIAEYTTARSFVHGGLDYWIIRSVGDMTTDQLAAAVLGDRETRNGKQQRSTVRSN